MGGSVVSASLRILSKARVREGDRIMTVLGGSTVDNLVFFSNYGSAYTIRIGDIPPARSGYGDPAQKLFKFKDGERIVEALSLDPRMLRLGAFSQQVRLLLAPFSPYSTNRRILPQGT